MHIHVFSKVPSWEHEEQGWNKYEWLHCTSQMDCVMAVL